MFFQCSQDAPASRILFVDVTPSMDLMGRIPASDRLHQVTDQDKHDAIKVARCRSPLRRHTLDAHVACDTPRSPMPMIHHFIPRDKTVPSTRVRQSSAHCFS